jgi:hypothetical protein
MRCLIPAMLMLMMVGASSAQSVRKASKSKETDLIEVLVKAFNISIKEKDPTRKRVSFSIMPVSSTSSAGNKILVSSISAAFILGHQDSTKVSSLFLLPYTDFSENFGIGIKQNLWTPNNIWNIPGEYRFSSLSQYSYGLGSSSEEKDRLNLKYKTVKLYLAANHKITGHYFGGMGISYDRAYNIEESGYSYTPSAYSKYTPPTGSTSLSTGLDFSLLYDDRKNSINPDAGTYASFVYRINPTWMANDQQWNSVYADFRQYFSQNSDKRRIFAIWAFYWGSFGNVPYFNLPGTTLELGGRSGRGYYTARYRGKHMLYFETEYRFDLSRNGLFGGVLFANLQSLSELNTNQFQGINPGAGFGARIKFNKESKTNITLDFGFGQNSFGFYIGLGEFY